MFKKYLDWQSHEHVLSREENYNHSQCYWQFFVSPIPFNAGESKTDFISGVTMYNYVDVVVLLKSMSD